MYKIFFFLQIFAVFAYGWDCGALPKIENCKPIGVIPENYTLIDLGETDLPPECLDRFSLPQTFAPRITNSGIVAYNTIEQAFIRQQGSGEVAIQKNYIPGHLFGINNQTDLLLTFEPSPENMQWNLWKMDLLRKVKEVSIWGEGIPAGDLYFRSLNDQGTAVGIFRPAGRYRPVHWSSTTGLHHLGFFFGWDLEGVAWDVNNNGTVVGTFYPPHCDPQVFYPFAWNDKWGLERLSDYIPLIKAQLRKPICSDSVCFNYPLIDQDDTVYGQVTVGDEIYHYIWYPRSHDLRLTRLGDLKLNAVNSKYVFGGSLNGEAALYQRFLEPVLLSTLIQDLPAGWELIDISDLNDACALVGVGKVEGRYHLFHAVPSPKRLEELPPPPPPPLPQPEVKQELPKQEPLIKYIFENASPDVKGSK